MSGVSMGITVLRTIEVQIFTSFLGFWDFLSWGPFENMELKYIRMFCLPLQLHLTCATWNELKIAVKLDRPSIL